MDSTAYKSAITEIQQLVGRTAPEVPFVFVRCAVSQSPQAFEALVLFLDCIAAPQDMREIAPSGSRLVPHPLLSASPRPFLAETIAEMHHAIAQRIRNSSHEPPSQRRNFSGVVTFLINAVHPLRCLIFRPNDCSGYAMAAFLIEAGMALGWCPNAFEGHGKRAAHLYFSHAKKALLTAKAPELAAVLAYLWGAWLMAQKTEGIRDHALAHENADAVYTYTFQTDTGNRTYTSYHCTSPPHFLTIAHGVESTVSIFQTLACDGGTGLELWHDGMPLTPFELIDQSPISQPDIAGVRIAYRCRAPQSGVVRWLTTVQFLGNTIYRIDALQAEGKPLSLSRIRMSYENALPLHIAGPGLCRKKETEGFVVQLIENPFGLVYKGQDNRGVSMFEARCGMIIGNKMSVRITSAVRSGTSAGTIDKTHLSPLFEI